ncbi:MAG: DUF488 domain-containing protein [Methanotrichaceae archaeon]|jgi:uncharacterized protein (DUF488 family)
MIIVVYTIGHSTHTIGEFIGILKHYGIKIVVDVRKIAKSRHNPQFNEDNLRSSLARQNIEYLRMEGLAGLRHTTKLSINTAWKNLSFRGYADHMQTLEFKTSIEQLIGIAREKQTAIMCAEAVPWRCHRSLIADALLIRDTLVVDIMTEKVSRPHKMTPFAKVEGNVITYPENT